MRSFDDLQKDYTGDGEKSFLTLSIPVDEQIKQYQIGMLEKNRLELLLPLAVQRVNDEWKLSCDITSKIPLSRVLERKALQHHEFEFIIRQFAAMVHDLKEYLLDLPSVVLDKKYIFCDPAEFTLYFIYLPVKASESEPERIKSFLRKLIIEDIRLVEDVSGTLLKKLLDALKSEVFTSELLYQCINGSEPNPQQASEQAPRKNDAEPLLGEERERFPNKAFIPAIKVSASNNPKSRADKTSTKAKHDGSRNGLDQPDYPVPRSNRVEIPANKARNVQSSPYIRPVSMTDNQHTGKGLSALLQKYPKPSWFIAGGVNLLLFGILIYILASAGRNPNNTISNITGFLLITAACNYFLITRLFSKDELLPVPANSGLPAGSTTIRKRFANRNTDEDIILPKNPAMRFRGESNHEKEPLTSTSSQSAPIDENLISGEKLAEKGISPDEDRKPQPGARQKEAITSQVLSDVHSKPEISMESSHANSVHAGERKAADKASIEKNNLASEAIAVHPLKGNTFPEAERLTEPVIAQGFPCISEESSQASGAKSAKNQSFPDKTMVLGRSSLQAPCLVSQTRPYEKILLDKSTLLIGRLADSVDFVIQNRAVGKIHAEVKKIGEHYYIVDLNSVNGTYVNGERLICNTETRINNGDKITLANESYTFIAPSFTVKS